MDSIFNNGFSFELLSDDESLQKIIYESSNYYSLHANSYYNIKLSNGHNSVADAYVYINNNRIGIYRVNPNSTIVVDKDGNGNRFKMIKHQKLDQGLIKVVFVLGKQNNNFNYINPVRTTKPDISIYRWNCHNNYTDGVTPSNANNRRCLTDALEYDTNMRPMYGEELKKTFVSTSNRYSKTVEIDDKNNQTIIYAQLFINDDFSFNKHYVVDNIRDDKTNPSVIPPDVIEQLKKMGRHKCPSYYNKSYAAATNTCSNHVSNNGGYMLPSYGRYTNGVFGGPSYNSWAMGTASPIHANKNIYRENNYY